MKKILALDQGEYLGGAELFFSDLIQRVAGDFEIHLITGKNPSYHQRYKKSPIHLHQMDLPALKPIGLGAYKKYRQAQKKISLLIDQLQPDLILSNTVRTHLLVSKLAQKKQIPLVWMAHDRTFPKPLLKWLKKCPQSLVSCSEFVQDFYRQSLGERADLNWKVLYPFALEPHQLDPYASVKKEKVIGMIGKFIPWKGQDLFLKTAQKIHELYPDYRFELIASVYENNPESLKFYEACRSLIEDLDLTQVVNIKSSVEDIFQELTHWDILVHCSREPESLGRVILEGMASGCAVVASHLGGPKEIVRHRENGLVVPPEVDEVFKAVQWYVQHAAEKQSMAQLARLQVLETHLWPNRVGEFKLLLEDTLGLKAKV